MRNKLIRFALALSTYLLFLTNANSRTSDSQSRLVFDNVQSTFNLDVAGSYPLEPLTISSNLQRVSFNFRGMNCKLKKQSNLRYVGACGAHYKLAINFDSNGKGLVYDLAYHGDWRETGGQLFFVEPASCGHLSGRKFCVGDFVSTDTTDKVPGYDTENYALRAGYVKRLYVDARGEIVAYVVDDRSTWPISDDRAVGGVFLKYATVIDIKNPSPRCLNSFCIGDLVYSGCAASKVIAISKDGYVVDRIIIGTHVTGYQVWPTVSKSKSRCF